MARHLRYCSHENENRTAKQDFIIVAPFMGARQKLTVITGLHGEEGQFFRDKLAELAEIIVTMPTTGQTDGHGGNAVAHLRYFAGGEAEFLITEKDIGSPNDTAGDFQSQAFGQTDLGYGPELGYISIPEIIAAGGELDFHWNPKTLKEAK